MEKKIKLQLTPYDALSIYAFLSEYRQDIKDLGQNGIALSQTIDNYEKEIFSRISDEEIQDALQTNAIKFLNNEVPPKVK